MDVGAPEPDGLVPRPCPACGAGMRKTRGPGEATERLLATRWVGSFECRACGKEFRISEEKTDARNAP